MTKQIHIGDVKIPVTQYASQGNAVLGIRDSGKTYSATYLAEQLYAAKIPFVAFDPSGVWKFLRVPGNGDGLPVVVAGGKSPDLPLTPQSAPEIVRAAMRANVSLVLDFYDIHLSKADWGRIVEQCIRVLLYENGEHGLRHVFIEEAAEFAPQQVTSDKAKVYAEVEKLARIGGNALLGYTLINQRAEQVNKAVLELCDCLFLHRQKGKNSLKSLEKWLDYSQGGGSKEIVQGLPTLPTGECWIWPAGAESATHVKMPTKRTFHPDRRALIASPAAASIQRVDATEFVSELKASLDKFVQEADASDPKKLKARIVELEKKLGGLPVHRDSDDALVASQQKEIERQRAEIAELWNNIRIRNDELNTRADVIKECRDALSHLPNLIARLDLADGLYPKAGDPDIAALVERNYPKLSAPVPMAAPLRAGASVRTAAVTPAPRSSNTNDNAGRRILTAIAQNNRDGATHRKIGILADVSPGGSTWRGCFARFRKEGLIEERGDVVFVTPAGVRELGDYDPLPTGEALRDYWRGRLGNGTRLAIFDAVCDRYPRGAQAESVALDANVELGGSTWRGHMAKLRALDLVSGSDQLTANAELFG